MHINVNINAKYICRILIIITAHTSSLAEAARAAAADCRCRAAADTCRGEGNYRCTISIVKWLLRASVIITNNYYYH